MLEASHSTECHVRRPSWFFISIGAMAFGSRLVALEGALLFFALCMLLLSYPVFLLCRALCRRLFRVAFPRPVGGNECTQEMLDYWKPWSDRLRRDGRLFPP
jgi:hypothetical protein